MPGYRYARFWRISVRKFRGIILAAILQRTSEQAENSMDKPKYPISTDFDLLNRLEPLSLLSREAVRELAVGLHTENFKPGKVVIPEADLATSVHILLKGTAKITYLNRRGERVTVALLAPGPIPEIHPLTVTRWHFRCEAHSDCRVGGVRWERFDSIMRLEPKSALRRFRENNLMSWYRFFAGDLDVRERLVCTLLELCSKFGIEETRGTLLSVSLSHKDLSDLVGASRPRVTEQLAQLVREHLVVRQNRQLIVRVDKIAHLTRPPSVSNAFFSKICAGANKQPHAPREDRFCVRSSTAPAFQKARMAESSADAQAR
jgi:CRP/FNR family transcriptional regulator, cyclic AMP receptor protein